MQAEAAQLRGVAKALPVGHHGGVRHFLGRFDVPLKAPVQVVVAAKLVDGLQDILCPAQGAVVLVPVHGLPEGVYGFLAVGPQIQEVHLLRQRVHKALHHPRHGPDGGRRVGPHAPAVKEEAGVRHGLADGLVGILGKVHVDVDKVLNVRGDVVFRGRRGGEMPAGAIGLNPGFHAGADQGGGTADRPGTGRGRCPARHRHP